MKSIELYQKIFPSCVWRLPSSEGKILYLTFDDGPIESVTPWVLDTLIEYQVKAHFFCVGDNVQRHPAIFKRLQNEGHRVGNHTQNHLNAWKVPKSKYILNIEKAERMMGSKMFRPPYGKITRAHLLYLRKHAYQVVMWDVLTKDYDLSISPEQCFRRSIQFKNGSIVLFHDSVKAEPNLRYALPRFLDYALKEGYQFALLPSAMA